MNYLTEREAFALNHFKKRFIACCFIPDENKTKFFFFRIEKDEEQKRFCVEGEEVDCLKKIKEKTERDSDKSTGAVQKKIFIFKMRHSLILNFSRSLIFIWFFCSFCFFTQ